MTCVSVFVAPSKQWATVAVDSVATRITDGTRGEINKLHVLPTCGAVITGRGPAGFVSNVGYLCHASGFGLRQLIDNMQEQLNATILETEEYLRNLKAPLDETKTPTIVLIGWDEEQQRIEARIWGAYENEPRFTPGVIETSYVAPAVNGLEPSTPKEIERIAREQCRRFRAEHPEMGAGGKLILARISEAGINVRTCEPGRRAGILNVNEKTIDRDRKKISGTNVSSNDRAAH